MVCLCTIAAGAIVVYYLARYLWEFLKVGELDKKAVLITGCDTGFGHNIALQCARSGHPTFAGCLTQKGIDSLKSEENSSKLRPFLLDITKQESVDDAVKFVEKNLNNGEYLWALVHNAGVFTIFGPDDWTTPEIYQKSFDVNCLGMIRVTHAFKKHIKKNGGRVIATSSISGRVSFPCTGAYAVAKYGVEAYIDALRQEVKQWGVKCSLLEPGAFKTPLLDQSMHKRRVDSVWEKLDEETKEEYGNDYKDFFIENWNNALDQMGSSQLHYVTDNYYHAITAKYPRCRYRCGWDSMFFYIPLTYFPTEAQDAVFEFLIKRENKKNILPAVFSNTANKKSE